MHKIQNVIFFIKYTKNKLFLKKKYFINFMALAKIWKCGVWAFSGSSTALKANLIQVKQCISILDIVKGLCKS